MTYMIAYVLMKLRQLEVSNCSQSLIQTNQELS